MASDLSSGCDLSREGVDLADEKEEGEISLEDVSSSEEGQPAYGYGIKSIQCPNCPLEQVCGARCIVPTKFSVPVHQHRSQLRRDAAHGKENLHYIREPAHTAGKHSISTLQEKNDDLVPISSDSDMEIVGLLDNSGQVAISVNSKTKTKKKKKKKRNHASVLTIDDLESSSSINVTERLPNCLDSVNHQENVTKEPTIRMHHREFSPIHRSARTRIPPRTSPRRHRSPVRNRSPYRKSRSPLITRARSPINKRSPRRQIPQKKSPKRSPRRSPVRSTARKPNFEAPAGKIGHPTSAENVQKLLKRVRELDAVGTHSLEETLTKNKEHASSLKEKLLHMMKVPSGNVTTPLNCPKDKVELLPNSLVSKEMSDVDDEEEDLALLRQQALETKQKKAVTRTDQVDRDVKAKSTININDDQDEEDLQLRMIALRSAVLKKHRNRVQRGVNAGKKKASRSESPFTQSFLDSIPIPGEQLLNFASPPHTPPPMNESSPTEDMDLDTDVEREKERLPYSPTDKITTNIPIDTEMLGIQPSDVSFISLHESANNQSIGLAPPTGGHRFSQILPNRSYLPNTLSHGSTISTPFNIASNNVISEPNSKQTGHVDHVGASSLNQQMPYSPTDTPICDLEIPQTSDAPGYSRTLINCSALSELPGYDRSESHEHLGMCNQQIHRSLSNKYDDQHLVEQIGGSGTNSLIGSPSPASLITIDDLPESDIDIPSSAGSLKSDLKNYEHVTNSVSGNNSVHTVEPLYMQGIPDISKDSNKIPTLINRTLVPASILKSNKQLQKPLPVKKSEITSEPSFKSAEMQPVLINKVSTSNTSTIFKPMKFSTPGQKVPTLLKPSTAFRDPLQEVFESETQCNKNAPASRINASNPDANDKLTVIGTDVRESARTRNDEIPTQKREEATKKGVRRKNSGSVESIGEVRRESAGGENKRYKQSTESSLKTLSKVMVGKSAITESSPLSKSLESVNTANLGDLVSEGSVGDQKKQRSRRQSLDDDEDALRASLLASLPKRLKASESTTTNTSPIRMTSALFNVELKQASELNKVKSEPPQRKATDTKIDKNLLTPSNQQATPRCCIVKEVVVNDQTKENNVSQGQNIPVKVTQKPVATVLGKKRPILPNKGPNRKIIKRPPISASTKVVNNAKKYQNAIMQKRLNLQKTASNKVQPNENKWPLSGKMNAEAQRIVINLQSDTESDSDIEREKNTGVHPPVSHVADKAHANPSLTIDFEKNLDQFLRDVRKKQESVAALKSTPQSPLPKKQVQIDKQSAANLQTPLAVRHLPASKQAEYRRLKQQILEHEKLKLRRAADLKGSKGVTAIIKDPTSQESNQPQPLSKEKEQTSISIASPKIGPSPAKQLSSSSKQIKIPAMPMANLSIRISNENSPQTSAVNRSMSNSSQIMNSSRTVVESTGTPTILQEATINKVSPVLRVLTGAEINRKFVHIQVKHDTNERIVTINEQTNKKGSTISAASQNEKAVVSESNIIKPPAPVLTEKIVDDSHSTRSVDSDASTIVLARDNQPDSTRESVDAGQSTIILSQREESNPVVSEETPNKVAKNPVNATAKVSNENRGLEEGWDIAKIELKATLSELKELPAAEQAEHLKIAEQQLVTKRYAILDELAEMSGNLRQWHMERDLQTYLVAEVKKLREQLRVAEERLQVQRDHIKAICPKVVAAHKKIDAGRQECFKLSKICSALGTKVIGKKYKMPAAGANLLEVRLKEVANHTRQLSKKKVSTCDDTTAVNTQTTESSAASEKSNESPELARQKLETEKPVDSPKVPTLQDEEKSCSPTRLKDSEELQFEAALSQSLEIVAEKDGSLSNESLSLTKQENTLEQETTLLNMQPEGSSTPISEKTKKIAPDDKANPPGSPSMTGCWMDGQRCKRVITPYVSILAHMKVPRNANPNGVLCPYELMGTCNDGDCQFIHHSESQAK